MDVLYYCRLEVNFFGWHQFLNSRDQSLHLSKTFPKSWQPGVGGDVTVQIPFRLIKNPYHLFNEYMTAHFRTTQKQNAAAVRYRLPAGAPAIDESKMVEFLKRDYIDVLSDEAAQAHIEAINVVLSEKLNQKIDIISDAGRKLLESDGYAYPAPEDYKANSAYNVFRGIWQLFHPSIQHAHIGVTADQHIRSALVIFYGFISSRAHRDKRDINLIIIGKSTLWRGTAWTGPEKLYVHATECLRRDVFEDQFFVFQLPGYHDYLRRRSITEMQGVLAGTVLDGGYEGRYPVVAAPCVARKLDGFSNWFQEHDRTIDADLFSRLKKEIGCGYVPLNELKSRSHESLSADATNLATLKVRREEVHYGLERVLAKICDEKGALLQPILRS